MKQESRKLASGGARCEERGVSRGMSRGVDVDCGDGGCLRTIWCNAVAWLATKSRDFKYRSTGACCIRGRVEEC